MEPSNPVSESLLVHATFVQQLARRLAGADGDDLAQDIWTAALRAGPANVRGMRSWLGTIAANLWRNHARSRVRRQQRERTAAAGDCPSVVEILEREEARREVVGAVVALPERLRTVVLLRFFEGLDSAAIGARLGLPPSTVRAQLQQALARLRRQLDERHGQRRAAWSVPLLGCAAAPTPALPLLLSIGWPLRAALGAVLLVLVWFGVGLITGVPPAAPEPGAVVPIATAEVRGERERRPVDGAAPERTEVVANEAPWVVRGEVMHGSVGPMPGAHFQAQLFAGPEAKGEPLATAELVSDEAGNFAWPLPRPSGVVTLQFAQSRADTRVMADARIVQADAAAPQDLTVFVFRVDCRVRGRVTDADGLPVAGAWVVDHSFRGPPHACDADGGYALTTVATYGDTTVTAGAPGCVLRSQTVKVNGGDEVTMDFRLAPAARLAGRVIDAAGVGIADALVYTFATREAAVRTDAEGRFELVNLDPTRARHTLQAEHEGYLAAQQSLVSEELGAPSELVLRRGARIAGRVFGSDGRPFVGARIRLLMQDDLRPFVYATSQADGTFGFASAPAGAGTLQVVARGHAPMSMPLAIAEQASAVPDVVVQLERGHFLAGRIVDRSGRGLHRVRLTPLAPGSSGYREIGTEVYSRRDGSFRIDDLPPGSIDLDCFGMGMAQKREPGLAVDRADVTIAMEPTGRLAGRVLDDATGEPLPRFTIRLVAPELHVGERGGGGYGVEWSKGVAFTDTDGYWDTDSERLEAGMVFGVEASAPGYGPLVVRRVVAQPAAEPADLLLRLRPAARIAGRVVDQRGQGIAGVRLTVLRAEQPAANADPLADSNLVGRTQPDGSFELAGVPAGRLSLLCQHAEWPLTLDGPFATAAGQTSTRTIAMPRAATLRVTVLDLQGQPLAGVKLVREAVEVFGLPLPPAFATTDVYGCCRFANLPTARYSLHGSCLLADGATIVYAAGVDVTVGQDQELRLQPAGTGAVEVELVCEEALPETMSVRLWCPDAGADALFFAVELSGGRFVVRGLPAGDFRVDAAHTNQTVMAWGSARATVVSAQTTPVRIACSVRRR